MRRGYFKRVFGKSTVFNIKWSYFHCTSLEWCFSWGLHDLKALREERNQVMQVAECLLEDLEDQGFGVEKLDLSPY